MAGIQETVKQSYEDKTIEVEKAPFQNLLSQTNSNSQFDEEVSNKKLTIAMKEINNTLSVGKTL